MQPGRLGRFQILRELGKGAMGRVYLAYDPKIQRQVALKTIVPDPDAPPAQAAETRERFLREAQACGRLLHPNIVTVFDVGEDGGLSFIAMEFVEGETLDIYTDPKTLLPIERVLKIVGQACEALDYAHARNIVHRDIKPANLLLMSGDYLKITDFGLARQPSAAEAQNGMVIGTPFYMSPEQLAGKPVDGRSDLFSLGVVLYQLLTGVRPFPGESVSTIVYRIMYEKPAAPKIVNEKLPAHFNTVLERALAKEAADRFQGGAEFVKALEAYRDAYMPPAVPPGDPGEATRPLPVIGPADKVPTRPQPPSRRSTPPAPQRREGGAAASRPRPKPAPRRAPPPPEPMLAGRPGKISFVGLSLIAAVLLFPRSIGPEPPPGSGDSMHLAGIAGGNPVFGPVTGELRVWVTTVPPGGTLQLDGEPLDGTTFALSLGDDAEHRLVGRSGCRVGEQVVRVAERPEAIHLELTPEVVSVEVNSEPEGAELIVDGQATGRHTPTRVELDRCRAHRVALRKAGYYQWEREFAEAAAADEYEQGLGQAALRRIPNGYVQIASPEGYTVEIFENNRRIGTSGERLTLPAGSHQFVLRNERHFVEQSLRVEVEGRTLIEPTIDLPLLGFLTILALPSNCKIYVGDRYLDIPPVVDYPIAAATYIIRAEYIPTGEIREEQVQVVPGRQHRLTFRFDP